MGGELSTPTLPPRLREVVAGISDAEFGDRLSMVYVAAASAIERLARLDLLEHEPTIAGEGPDLSLWERMAPVIRDTVLSVNALLLVIREQFPQHQPGGLADTLTKVVDAGRGQEQRRIDLIDRALQDALTQLAQEITHLGERMRSPEVVSDRWNLLADLQEFRARFRHQIGELVYATALTFADVQRVEVIPGYKEELALAISSRARNADLHRVVGARRQSIEEAQPEDLTWNLAQLQKEVAAFSRTTAFRDMRAQDKRRMLELRQQISSMTLLPTVDPLELVDVAELLLKFTQSLLSLNAREILQENDRQVWAATGVHLEQAELVFSADPRKGVVLLDQAAQAAQNLYGCSAALDAFLREAKKRPIAKRTPKEAAAALIELRQLLALLPMG